MSAQAKERSWPGRAQGLSEREAQVLVLCADGLTNQQIADALYVSVETVKTHLRNIYTRLGVRGRVNLVSFLHTSGEAREPIDMTQPVRTSRVRRTAAAAADMDPLTRFGLDDEAIAQRVSLLGLGEHTAETLVRFAAVAAERAPGFRDELRVRLDRFADEWGLIDEYGIERLCAAQSSYLGGFFVTAFDATRVEQALRLGASLRPVGLQPEWHVATFGPLLDFVVDVIMDTTTDRASAAEALAAAIGAAFFDLSLVLDGYGASLRSPSVPDSALADIALIRSHLSPTPLAARRELLGVDDARIATLRTTAAGFTGVLEELDRQYESVVQSLPEAGAAAGRFETQAKRTVHRYWAAFADRIFNEDHAASASRLGLYIDRFGVTPVLNVVGMGAQLLSAVRTLVMAPGDGREASKAILTAVLFDVIFMLDAYCGAQLSGLALTGQFDALGASGFATGVMVLDANNRIEHANEPMRAILSLPDGTTLRRSAIDDALPFDDLPALIEAARSSPFESKFQIRPLGDLTVRITAVSLGRTSPSRDAVALIVQDATDLIQAMRHAHRDVALLGRFLDLIDATGWEADIASRRFVASTPSFDALLGRSDNVVVTRSVLHQVHPDDRPAFERAWAEAVTGRRAKVTHRWVRRHGKTITTDTYLTAVPDQPLPKVAGVSIAVDEPAF